MDPEQCELEFLKLAQALPRYGVHTYSAQVGGKGEVREREGGEREVRGRPFMMVLAVMSRCYTYTAMTLESGHVLN